MENDILKYLNDLVVKQWEIGDDNLDKEEEELYKDYPNAIWVGSDDKTSIIQKREVLYKLSDFFKELYEVSHEIYEKELNHKLIDEFHYHFIHEKNMKAELIYEMTNWLKEKLNKILKVRWV